MRALALAVLLAIVGGLASAAEDEIRSSLSAGKAPWYDTNADSWRRVEPPELPVTSMNAPRISVPGIPIFAYVMCVIAIAVLLGIASMLLRGRRALYQEQRESESVPLPRANISALGFAPATGREDPEAALAAAMRAGDWTTAVIWIYALMLMRLDRGGIIRVEPGKTNRAYHREAAAAPPAATGALDAGIDAFERTYFGHLGVDRAAVTRLLDQRAQLESALGAVGGA